MEIFGDFECPACRAFLRTTVKQVIDDYVVPGKVYIVHRDFPLDMHPYARQAARSPMPPRNLGNLRPSSGRSTIKQDEWTAKGQYRRGHGFLFPPGADSRNFRTMKRST
jgi:hypothetical protein